MTTPPSPESSPAVSAPPSAPEQAPQPPAPTAEQTPAAPAPAPSPAPAPAPSQAPPTPPPTAEQAPPPQTPEQAQQIPEQTPTPEQAPGPERIPAPDQEPEPTAGQAPAPEQAPPAVDPYAVWQQPAVPVQLPPPPPKRSKAPLITGIVTGFIVVVAIGLAWLSNHVRGYLGDAPDGGSTSGPAYQVTVPSTLADGKYALSEDITPELTQEAESNPLLSKLTAAGARYRTGSGSSTDVVTFSGYFGTIPDPAMFRVAMLGGLMPDKRVAAGPKALVSAGSQRTVNCEVLNETDSATGEHLTVPVCVWDDSSTVILVYRATPQIVHEAPSAVDLQPLADLTGTVIDEVRTPAP